METVNDDYLKTSECDTSISKLKDMHTESEILFRKQKPMSILEILNTLNMAFPKLKLIMPGIVM